MAIKYFFSLACIAALVLILTACDVTVSTGSGSGNGGYSTSGSSSNGSSYGSTKRSKKSNGSYGSSNGSYGSSNAGPTGQSIGQRTKSSGCQAQGGLEDKACTPGAIFPNATKDQICQSGYSSSVRNVPVSEKDQVYSEYGIQSHTTGQYEVDHLVSLELGGSNDIANLWPEAASPKPGFHEKDQVENYLHSQVCSGAISLHDAQVEIANNWLNVYSQMSGSK